MGTKTQKLSNVVDQIIEWQSVFTGDGSTGLTAVAGRGYFIDTTSGTFTVTLPGSAKVGDTIALKDYNGTWGTNNVTISSTLKISGADADGTLSTNNTTVTIVYMDTTKGWTPIQNSTQSALASDDAYVTATGGTVTTSGDYKIHTFTGDGCFVVSCAGNPGGSDTVDYLVVAGGGAGGNDRGGGGGAGGVRFYASPDITSYPSSPRNGPGAIAVSTTTYPITVGGGAAQQPGFCGSAGGGSNSIFATITSTGGGGGGNGQPSNSNAGNGGSGGGSRDACGVLAGSGNTPPVSPPQGSSGGPWSTPGVAGGGGGFMAVGGTGGAQPATPSNGNGGIGGGFPTTFVGTNGEPSGCQQYFGGGGAGGTCNQANPFAGLGGGGIGNPPANPADAKGDANTGGGGGGGQNGNTEGGAGGKGIVIIRYKFQN